MRREQPSVRLGRTVWARIDRLAASRLVPSALIVRATFSEGWSTIVNQPDLVAPATKLGPWRPAHGKVLLPDWTADELDAKVEAGRGTRAKLVRAAVCYGINNVDAEFNRELKRLGGADPEGRRSAFEARMAGTAWRPPRTRVSGIRSWSV